MYNLKTLLQNQNLNPFFNYLTTLFGATAMYIFSLNKGFQGSIEFLKKFFPDKSQVFYNRLDFFIVIIAGSIIGTIFFNPTNNLEALAAGFGWVGAINVLMSQTQGKNLDGN